MLTTLQRIASCLPKIGYASIVAAGLIGLSACGSSTSSGSDAAVTHNDAGPGADAAPDCYTNPTTYLEIINACTTADHVSKTLNLPLLVDGGLPAIP